MSPLALTGLIFGLMLLLMALRAPIAIAMFVAGCIGYVLQSGLALTALIGLWQGLRGFGAEASE